MVGEIFGRDITHTISQLIEPGNATATLNNDRALQHIRSNCPQLYVPQTSFVVSQHLCRQWICAIRQQGHLVSQFWPNCMYPYSVTRPQWLILIDFCKPRMVKFGNVLEFTNKKGDTAGNFRFLLDIYLHMETRTNIAEVIRLADILIDKQQRFTDNWFMFWWPWRFISNESGQMKALTDTADLNPLSLNTDRDKVIQQY